MIRQIATKTIKYSYVKDFKKPIVEMPSTVPPKYIYKIEYHPNAKPSVEFGYRDHAHYNDFEQKAFVDFELFQFKYSGQTWERSGFSAVFICFALPIWGYYQITRTQQANQKSGLPCFNKVRITSDAYLLNSIPIYNV